MNRFFGVGKILHTPQLTHADKPEPILRLSLVTNEINDNGNEAQQFHNVVLRGEMAAHWSTLLSKNDVVSVVCEVRYYSSNRGGTKRRITEMFCFEIRIVVRADNADIPDTNCHDDTDISF